MDIPEQNIDQKLQKLQKTSNDNYALISALCIEVEKLKKGHQCLHDCTKKSLEKSDFDSHKEVLKTDLDTIKTQVFSLQDHKDAHRAFIKIINEEIDQFREMIKESLKKIDSFMPLLQEVKSSITSARTDLDSNMNYVVQNTKKEIFDRLQKMPLKEECLTLKQVEDHLKSRLESVGFEASNAYLLSKKCDDRLEVLEKKVENVLLKLK